MKKLTGKVAIVTGGSSGIGRAIVQKFTDEGAAVVFNYHKNQEQSLELVQEIKGKGGKVEVVQADIGKVADVLKIYEKTKECFGRIDIVVNNAGMANYKPIEHFSEEEFDEIFSLNVKGLFFSCREAARVMEDNGAIINIGSTVTKIMLPEYGAYAATKGAVEQISKVLAKELGHRNIRVNTLSPGPVDTELFRRGKTKEQIRNMEQMAALGRIASPEEIAELACILSSSESGWITGQNIMANGGLIG